MEALISHEETSAVVQNLAVIVVGEVGTAMMDQYRSFLQCAPHAVKAARFHFGRLEISQSTAANVLVSKIKTVLVESVGVIDVNFEVSARTSKTCRVTNDQHDMISRETMVTAV